ncbi:multidrug ABC transporter substrate-binding protein [Pseudarthrobacter sulfonivorans]|uniref:Multidrug ABC transporter substrate-binding protein n=1 Tax=Pseudarthrobacter sulfonivorans TaxID=121292 RepID=A0A0U3P8H1_9MICC|nr:FtsX-like permease family protein [Pseudarthrobacter sulfonivorans]ALV40531.1 multidrug ABC transporter substrate-binding protein [Pseudarthrobacter sulfonivorans]
MSVLARSVGNAFRNKVRTAAVVAVLAVAIGLALAMLVANQAVGAKVQELNASVGTVLTVNPAGGQGFEGGGEPLTAEQAATAAAVPNVTSVVGTSSLRLRNAAEAAAQTAAGTQAGPGGGQGGPAGQNATTLTTSLTAAVDAGTLGGRNQAANGTTGTTTAQPVRSLPITATGIGGEVDTTGKALTITQGTGLGDYTAESANALLGTTLAEKNNLTIGSTFTINDQTFTVAGLFDSGTTFGNNALYLTLPTAQTVAELPGELSSMIVTVDSMENLEAAKTALESALGTDKADVTQGQNLESAVSSLGSVKNISFIAFVAALGTAGLIILLIMVMLVRERRREIGVLKAIGAPNRTIGLQFVLEALVLVAMGSAVGAAVASFASGGIASALISTNTTTTAATTTGRGAAMAGAAGGAGMPGGGAGFPGGAGLPSGNPLGGASQLLTSVTASASPGVIAAGIAAVFGVAIIGALVPALLTARIRPIEVLRGE